MGLPGAGKSTLADGLIAQGYHRLNRDDAGRHAARSAAGAGCARSPRARHASFSTTPTCRASRGAEVIRAASARGFPVRCIWLVDERRRRADQRRLADRVALRHAAGDEELARLRKRDVAAFLPTVQFRYQRELEPPDASEGFSRIDVVPFERRSDPSFVNRAVIVWCDGVLLRSRSRRAIADESDDVDVAGGRAAVLRRLSRRGLASARHVVAARDRRGHAVAAKAPTRSSRG